MNEDGTIGYNAGVHKVVETVQPTVVPVVEPVSATVVTPVAEPVVTEPVFAAKTTVVTSTSTPNGFEKVLTTIQTYTKAYGYELLLLLGVILVGTFAILFPRLALGVGGIAVAASGWIAYFGLRKKEGI